MTQSRRWRRGLTAAVLGLTLLVGCRNADRRPAPPPPLASDDKPPPKLNARQVADVHIAMARGMEQQGAATEAAAAYQEALKLDPDRGDAWLRLAVLNDREGKFQESAGMYQKALAARPDDPSVYCDRGYSLYLQGRFADAERDLRQAIALRPEHARSHTNLGMVLARTDRAAEALEEFRKAGCADADAHCNLAFALTLERCWPEARAQYQQALALAPSSAAARKGLQQVDALVAKAEAARSEATAAAPPADPGVVPASWRPAPHPQPLSPGGRGVGGEGGPPRPGAGDGVQLAAPLPAPQTPLP
jgi:Tfp pilus assembly protein PilF